MRQLALPFPPFPGPAARGSAEARPVLLERIDPTQNMARFYHLEVARDLFGCVVLVRRWGRLGTFGHWRHDPHDDEGDALRALTALAATKHRRGYVYVLEKAISR
jgi:predicted DNA-binding WGR domain protein